MGNELDWGWVKDVEYLLFLVDKQRYLCGRGVDELWVSAVFLGKAQVRGVVACG